MKNKILFYLLLGSFSLLQFSCKVSDPITNIDCDTIDFTAIDFTKYPNLMIESDVWEDKFLIINSTDEFNKSIKFNDLVPVVGQLSSIDYNKYTLLIGKKKLYQGYGQLVNQSITCNTNKITYNMLVKNGGYQVLIKYIFDVLIPKVNKTDIFFNVNVM